MPNQTLRIGVLTGGGDCPGINAALRAVTKSLILKHDAEVLGFLDGFEGLVERNVEPLHYRDVSGILTQGGTILGASNRADPFNYHPRGGANVSAQVLKTSQNLGLDALVAIGGDGTMSIAHRLSELGIEVVGLPKTIDNDLVGTDRTFGFDTAVHIASEAIDRIHTTAQSHHRVMIVETMGCYAGWIALHAGLASGADVILLPELDYTVEEVARVCRERERVGQRFTIVAVAEGAKQKDGERVVQERDSRRTDSLRLGGIGNVLADELREFVDSSVRTTVLGHMQRGGTPTAYDRNLATAFGTRAAALAATGHAGVMVGVQDGSFTTVPLADVAGHTRTVPMDDPLLASALDLGISLGVPNPDVKTNAEPVPPVPS
jgi:6-phosphofructokinase 1